jgi:hypothetical protein
MSAAGAAGYPAGMPLTFSDVAGNIVEVKASGRLSDDDYHEFVPRMEALIERWGRLRLLFMLDVGFEGWDASAAWNELRFQVRHREHIKRVAVVGAGRWVELGSRISAHLTGVDVRYFEHDAAGEARMWISEGW